MTLNVALSSAVSSLLVVEKQMAVASNNISNANTEGYTQQTVSTSARVSNGNVMGVSGSVATTTIDQYLEQSIVQNNSSSSQTSTYYSYYQTLADSMGSISTGSTGSNDLASELTSLQTSLTTLSNTPNDTATKTKIVSQLSALTSDLRSTSAKIQNQRGQADKEIETAVTDANTQLSDIADLNKQISLAKATGNSTASLEDSRYSAVQALSSDIGVNYYFDSSGAMQIYTDSGTALLVGDTPRTLSHTATSALDASATYTAGASTGIDGIYVAGQDITSITNSGKIGALIKQRDTDLVNAQSELDNMASTLSTSLNTIHNLGTSATAPQTLTGTASPAFSGASALTVASGTTVRIAVIDTSGNAQSYADVDLSSCGTVDDVVNTINSAISNASPTMNASCSLSSAGQLVLSATNTNQGMGITTLSGSITDGTSSVTATDFSNYFHMNDLLTGGSSAETIKIRSDITSSAGYLSAGVLTSAASPGTPPFTAVTAGDGTVAASLASALSDNQSFAAAGYLSSTSKSFTEYAASIVSDVAQRSTNADSAATTASATLSGLKSTFSSTSGVNTDEQTAALTELQNLYAASAKVVTVVQSMFQSLLTAVQA